MTAGKGGVKRGGGGGDTVSGGPSPDEGLRYLLKAWSSCETMEDSLCKQSRASWDGGGPPAGWELFMV